MNNLLKIEKNYTKNKIQLKKKTFILLVISFVILNFFLSFVINISSTTKKIENSYFFTADLRSNLNEEEKNKTEIEVLNIEGVKKVRYLSKEEAFKKLQFQLDIAIPKGENPLSDSLLIYFDSPAKLEKIQENLENNQNIKEVFIDANFIAYKEREMKFYKLILVSIILGMTLPSMAMIYYIFYNAVSIEFLNNVDIIHDERVNAARSKKVNLLPFTAASIIGTLIFFNGYIYIREQMLKISTKYLILSLGEIVLIEGLIILMINILIWVNPLKLKKLSKEES